MQDFKVLFFQRGKGEDPLFHSCAFSLISQTLGYFRGISTLPWDPMFPGNQIMLQFRWKLTRYLCCSFFSKRLYETWWNKERLNNSWKHFRKKLLHLSSLPLPDISYSQHVWRVLDEIKWTQGNLAYEHISKELVSSDSIPLGSGVIYITPISWSTYTRWQKTLYDLILQRQEQEQTIRNQISYISNFYSIALLLLGIFEDF